METAFRLLSGAAWAYAYWRIIRISFQDRSYGIPLFAAILNLTWEAIYFAGGIFFWSKYGFELHLQMLIDGVWLVLDFGILTAIFLYGAREFGDIRKPVFFVILAALAILASILQASFLVQFAPEDSALLSAFMQNVYMSGAFISMALTRGNRRGQRIDIAAAKTLGTAMATISVSFSGSLPLGLIFLGVACFCLDSAYLLVLRRLPICSSKCLATVPSLAKIKLLGRHGKLFVKAAKYESNQHVHSTIRRNWRPCEIIVRYPP
jgi:hypothetical protein